MKFLFKPGDLLLYRNTWSLISWLIRVKTWSDVNHVEVYIGDGHVVAARAGGCKVYPVDLKHLHYVWRPRPDVPGQAAVNLTAAMDWFFNGATICGYWMPPANGTAYDFLGLFRFFLVGKQSTTKNFCSELSLRWLRAGGFHPFPTPIDADRVWPGGFIYSVKGDIVWRASQNKLHGEVQNVETLVKESPQVAVAEDHRGNG